VRLSGAASLTWNPVGSPTLDELKLLTAQKGGDTLHMQGAFPLRGEAYGCNPVVGAR